MVKVDSYYVMGQSHLVTQDYAISGTEPFPYIILSDGCSSSSHTDIGARLLAMAAKQYLTKKVLNNKRINAKKLILKVASKASAAANNLGAANTLLDATLMIVFMMNNQVYIYVFGDGAIFYTTKSGDFSIINISYSHNAPYYPVYQIDESRDKQYRMKSMNDFKISESSKTSQKENIYEPTELVFPVSELSSLLIATDGVSSFYDTKNSKPVKIDSIAKELSDFKNTKGDFIKRRIKRILKKGAATEIYNMDDLAVGAMILEKSVES